jgi:hypothetical protein
MRSFPQEVFYRFYEDEIHPVINFALKFYFPQVFLSTSFAFIPTLYYNFILRENEKAFRNYPATSSLLIN